MDDLGRLVTQVLTTFFNKPNYYGYNHNEFVKTAAEVASAHPKFIAHLAVYARKEFNMRSVSHVLTAILAHEPKGKEFTRRLVNAVVVRADDMSEILSTYIALYGKPIPNSLKKGLNDALSRFDECTLAKYKSEGKALKMRDVLRICHPRPQDEKQAAMWKRCIAGELETPLIWETELSAEGNTKEVWEGLIDSGKLGYMALLRYLPKIAEADPDNIDKIYETLFSKKQIRKQVAEAKQLPFRLLSVYKELEEVVNAHVAGGSLFKLKWAIGDSVENLARMPGKTAIAIPASGSMNRYVSTDSKVTFGEVGVLLGVIATQICENCLFLKYNSMIQSVISGGPLIFYQIEDICAFIGNNELLEVPFGHLTDKKINVDRIIVLCFDTVHASQDTCKIIQWLADDYRRKVNSDVWVHAMVLDSYRTKPFFGNRINIISGWSDKVLDFIQLAENGIDNLIKRVETYNWAEAVEAAEDDFW